MWEGPPPPKTHGKSGEIPDMNAKFRLFAKPMKRAKRASLLGIFLTLIAVSSASALGTPEQRRACTPDVYRLCAGEIPNVRAITACLMRQKNNLSPACRTAMEQNGY
jgi:hypothetical protein